MCVAAIINQPVKLSDLKLMEDDNPHGAGVAWSEGGEIQFRRGLTAAQIYAMQQAEEMTYPYLLHFRWATHGEKIPQLTHPFPTGNRAFWGELTGAADQVMIHNGVWNDYSKWEPYIEDTAPEAIAAGSDTSVAAYFLAYFPDLADHIPWAVAVATIDAAGEMQISKHGRTWLEHEGNSYSNLSWVSYGSFWTKYRTPSRALASGWSMTDEWEHSVYDDVAFERERTYSKKPVGGTLVKSNLDMSDLGFDDWTDYVRARYGDEVANDIRRDACRLPVTQDDAETDELDDIISKYGQADEGCELDLCNPDLISEDYATVNTYLANEARAKAA